MAKKKNGWKIAAILLMVHDAAMIGVNCVQGYMNNDNGYYRSQYIKACAEKEALQWELDDVKCKLSRETYYLKESDKKEQAMIDTICELKEELRKYDKNY